MTKEFVPYELAVRLKELGFDEPCLGKFYTKPKSKMFGVDEKGRHYPVKNISKKLYTLGEYFVLNEDNVIIAPLYQQAFRWFRDKRSCVCEIIRKEEGNHSEFIGWVYIDDRKIDVVSYWDSKTYEEAELACLIKLIEIVEQQNQK
jgi:hypothetical protein